MQSRNKKSAVSLWQNVFSIVSFRPRQKHEFSSDRELEYLTKPKVSPASSESRDDCGDAETLLGFLFLIPFPYNHLNPSSASFCEERSSQSNHAGKQRPCATQSELSLSCSGALNARSECSITGPEPRACTSTGCTGSTATSLQDGTTVAIPRKEMMIGRYFPPFLWCD